jgi:hypothetical protein
MPPVRFSGPPEMVWINDHEHWHLITPFTARWRNYEFTVPLGFETDMASIPRGLQWLIPQVGRHNQPSILHDYCYRVRPTPTRLNRRDYDRLFRDAMKSTGVTWWRRYLIWLAVRLFGCLGAPGKDTT